MWVEFFAGFRPCSRCCSPGPPVFPSSTIFYVLIRPGKHAQEESPHGMSTGNKQIVTGLAWSVFLSNIFLSQKSKCCRLTRRSLAIELSTRSKRNSISTRAYVLLLWSLFGKDGWILPLFFFCAFVDLDFATVHKNAKKELGKYSATMTSPLVNNAYVLHTLMICAAGCLAFPIFSDNHVLRLEGIGVY